MTTSQPLRVLLVNHWHDDNRGDSAINQGILSLVQETHPGSSVTVTTLAEEGDLSRGATRHVERAFPGVLTVLHSPVPTELRGHAGTRGRRRVLVDAAVWWLRMIPLACAVILGRPSRIWRDVVGRHDVVVLAGGSNIFDDAGVPVVLSLPRLLAVLSPAHTALRMHKPVLLLGHTLGPFSRPLGRRIVSAMLTGANLAVVRESRSVDVALRSGVRRAEERPDMAFALTPEPTARVRAMLEALPADPSRTLMLSVRQHPTQGEAADERLLDVFAEAARQLVAGGDVDGVAVVAHTVGPTPVEDDRPMSEQLVARLQGVPVTLVQEDGSPSELSAFYGGAAAVVAVRLHAAILALNAGTPTYAVAYLTGKTSGVMRQVGLPDAVGDFMTVSAADIVDGVRAQLGDPALRERLATAATVRRAALRDAAASWFSEVAPAEQPVRASAGG